MVYVSGEAPLGTAKTYNSSTATLTSSSSGGGLSRILEISIRSLAFSCGRVDERTGIDLFAIGKTNGDSERSRSSPRRTKNALDAIAPDEFSVHTSSHPLRSMSEIQEGLGTSHCDIEQAPEETLGQLRSLWTLFCLTFLRRSHARLYIDRRESMKTRRLE